MKFFYNLLLTILWVLAISLGIYMLSTEDKEVNFIVFSSISILLSALIASTSLMKSINNTNELDISKKQMREQENRILLAFIMRTVEQIAGLYIDKLTNIIENNTSDSIDNNQTIQLYLSNLRGSLKEQFDSMTDKEMLHVLFYDMSTELYDTKVSKLIELRIKIINVLTGIEDVASSDIIEKSYLRQIVIDLQEISSRAIEIKDEEVVD